MNRFSTAIQTAALAFILANFIGCVNVHPDVSIMRSINYSNLTISEPTTKAISEKSKFEFTLNYDNFDEINLDVSDIALESIDGYDTSTCEVTVRSVDQTRTVSIGNCEGNGAFKLKVSADSAK